MSYNKFIIVITPMINMAKLTILNGGDVPHKVARFLNREL